MKVVIAGAGFGGLKLARLLNNKPGFEVILIDRFNYHQFQPLFYQVATAGLNASDISFPLRKVFHKSSNINFRMATVQSIHEMDKKVITDIGEFEYDRLIMATGAGTNFFGNAEIEKYAIPMKSSIESLHLKERLLCNFEHALTSPDEATRQRHLNIIIVGGGPTGVELSGAIADMRHYVLPKDYPEIDFKKMNIYLLEGSPRLLAAMSEKSSASAQRYLEKLGVIVKTNALLKTYDGHTAFLANNELIESALCIWAAGIKGNIPAGIDASLIARGNRIKVDRFCKIQGSENMYAIGDIAFMETTAYPNGHPQLASVAIQQADLLATNFLKEVKAKNGKKEFFYNDKGSMATVGRNLAVVDIPKPKIHLGGFFAWFIWMSLHLMLILGVKNKFFVFMNWLYSYFTHDQNLRLIFRDHENQGSPVPRG